MWPFRKRERTIMEEAEVKGLRLDVSRERTKLYSNLAKLDSVVKSDALDAMVQRSLKLMEPKK